MFGLNGFEILLMIGGAIWSLVPIVTLVLVIQIHRNTRK
jgi:hypothetical protein